MQSELEAQRHALEKGAILKALMTQYAGSAVLVRALWGALDQLGYPLSLDNLQFSLQYLSDQGYVIATRVRDMAGFRTDRPPSAHPDVFVTVKLTVKGLQLVDGVGVADPLVMF